MFDLAKEARERAMSAHLPWEKLKGKTVLVTGATGLIGSTCVRLLLERNRFCGSDIDVACLVRDEARAAAIFKGYDTGDGLRFLEGSLEEFRWSSGEPLDYVIHAACPTASAFFVEHPVETADAIVLGTRRLLAVARDARTSGFVYASSMEAYGNGNEEPGLGHLLTEEDVGYVDPLSPRSSYPEGKRMAEHYCRAFSAEYGVPAMVVRLAQTFGPGIPRDDQRLFALCARAAMAGDDIVLHTAGASTRMYLYTTDAAEALLTVLLEGQPGRAYNAANPATYSSVRGMAEMVAALNVEGATRVRCEVDPNAPYPPEHHLPLDVSRLEGLGWSPRVDLAGMYANLMEYLEG